MRLRHARAAVVVLLDHLVLRQAVQSLADDGARNVEGLRQFDLTQPRARCQAALEDGGVDGVIDTLRRGVDAHFHPDRRRRHNHSVPSVSPMTANETMVVTVASA